MKSIKTCADMARFLASSRDADLNRLLIERRRQLVDFDGGDIEGVAHIIIVERADTLASVEGAAGVALATNFSDGRRLGDADFTDNFEWVEHHGVWIEAVTDFGDLALVLLVPDQPGIDAELLRSVRDRP